MNADDIVKLVNAGVGPISLFLLWQLWLEFRSQNAYIRDMLSRLIETNEQAHHERKMIANKIGITDSQLNLPIQPKEG